jgi:hypothetical protein
VTCEGSVMHGYIGTTFDISDWRCMEVGTGMMSGWWEPRVQLIGPTWEYRLKAIQMGLILGAGVVLRCTASDVMSPRSSFGKVGVGPGICRAELEAELRKVQMQLQAPTKQHNKSYRLGLCTPNASSTNTPHNS